MSCCLGHPSSVFLSTILWPPVFSSTSLCCIGPLSFHRQCFFSSTTWYSSPIILSPIYDDATYAISQLYRWAAYVYELKETVQRDWRGKPMKLVPIDRSPFKQWMEQNKTVFFIIKGQFTICNWISQRPDNICLAKGMVTFQVRSFCRLRTWKLLRYLPHFLPNQGISKYRNKEKSGNSWAPHLESYKFVKNTVVWTCE